MSFLPKEDIKYMKKALSLAKKGIGIVSPNPLVGAVIVKDHKLLASGYHKGFKKPHAEAEALRKAGKKAKGATIYVNLEPCCHWGNNPPCTKLIIEAGIKRVVYAMSDPNPLVKNCSAPALLRQAGIEVLHGVLEQEAQKLNEIFRKYIVWRKPFITLKMAQTLDGRIADRYGNSKWITNDLSRNVVQKLRYSNDAIMTGVGTILKDDPSLNVRLKNKTKSLTKIVVDQKGQAPQKAKIYDMQDHIVFITQKMYERKFEKLQDSYNNITVLYFEAKNQSFNFDEIMLELGKLNITSIIVEGGSQLSFSLMNQQMVDKFVIFVAPRIMGDNNALSIFNGSREKSINDMQQLSLSETKRYGDDLMLEYYPSPAI
ncbi:MAG: bifunctional diaminohydroxyphosphoribosylaminopyrimidine deaminase/5-amino-6-(5-phosphoribosylamino)uracil reductase RibD [Candidatus Margulisbacteria bacterium]|nr:bifunctional diaminohydroxyphosphoribosylaminopyrimidine deaminase/5-amino-6-(5-phosphoribosylamino)uracil reductase RibD [Candidatus Margulisiibacteriota bacterium]